MKRKCKGEKGKERRKNTHKGEKARMSDNESERNEGREREDKWSEGLKEVFRERSGHPLGAVPALGQ